VLREGFSVESVGSIGALISPRKGKDRILASWFTLHSGCFLLRRSEDRVVFS